MNNPFQVLADNAATDADSDQSSLHSSTNNDDEPELDKNIIPSSVESKTQQRRQRRNHHKHELDQKRNDQAERDQLAQQLKQEFELSKGKLNLAIFALLKQVHASIVTFMNSSSQQQQILHLSFMPDSRIRECFKYLAEHEYQLTYKMRGHHSNRHAVLHRTSLSHTRKPLSDAAFEAVVEHVTGISIRQMMTLQNQTKLQPSDGDVVAGHAQPINETNVGFRLFRKMQQDSLSHEETIVDDTEPTIDQNKPVEAIFRKGKKGLQ